MKFTRGGIYAGFLGTHFNFHWSNFFLKPFDGERDKLNFIFIFMHFWRFPRQKFNMAEFSAKHRKKHWYKKIGTK